MRKTTVIKRNGEFEWKSYFALFPVVVRHYVRGAYDYQPNALDLETTVWLERVERRITMETYAGDIYEYRLPVSTEK